jgi:hypothetical protein
MALIEQETVPARAPEMPVDTSAADLAQARFRRAQERVRAIRGFYIHLGIYLIVNLGIFALNWVLVQLSNEQVWFFYWPLLGWGIGVLINGFVVFGSDRFLGPEWEERKIREYLNRNC